MIIEIAVGVVTLLGSWGAVWYRVGKLTTESKGHNQRLDKLEKKVDLILKNTK